MKNKTINFSFKCPFHKKIFNNIILYGFIEKFNP